MQKSILTLIQDIVAIGGGYAIAHGLSQSTELAIAGAIFSVATVVVGQFFKNTSTPASK